MSYNCDTQTKPTNERTNERKTKVVDVVTHWNQSKTEIQSQLELNSRMTERERESDAEEDLSAKIWYTWMSEDGKMSLWRYDGI